MSNPIHYRMEAFKKHSKSLLDIGSRNTLRVMPLDSPTSFPKSKSERELLSIAIPKASKKNVQNYSLKNPKLSSSVPNLKHSSKKMHSWLSSFFNRSVSSSIGESEATLVQELSETSLHWTGSVDRLPSRTHSKYGLHQRSMTRHERQKRSEHRPSLNIDDKKRMPRSQSLDLAKRPSQRVKSPSHHIVETSVVYDKKWSQQSLKCANGSSELSQGKINQYHLLNDLGTGSFGKVVLAKDELTNYYYACKRISKSRIRKTFRFQALHGHFDITAEMKREVAVLKKLSKHSNIVHLIEVLDDSTEDELYLCKMR